MRHWRNALAGIIFLAVLALPGYWPAATSEQENHTETDKPESLQPASMASSEKICTRCSTGANKVSALPPSPTRLSRAANCIFTKPSRTRAFGGVGVGISPRTALAVGLKVDVDAPRECRPGPKRRQLQPLMILPSALHCSIAPIAQTEFRANA